jgi:hypothetical protein
MTAVKQNWNVLIDLRSIAIIPNNKTIAPLFRRLKNSF